MVTILYGPSLASCMSERRRWVDYSGYKFTKTKSGIEPTYVYTKGWRMGGEVKKQELGA